MNQTDAERELDSAQYDFAAALAHFKAMHDKLEAAEAWVDSAIKRCDEARTALNSVAEPAHHATAETVGATRESKGAEPETVVRAVGRAPTHSTPKETKS